MSVDWCPPTVSVLRERGPLSLRDATLRTAQHIGARMSYIDVDATLTLQLKAGNVEVVRDASDFRERVWGAVA